MRLPSLTSAFALARGDVYMIPRDAQDRVLKTHASGGDTYDETGAPGFLSP